MATTTAKEFLEDMWMLEVIKRKYEGGGYWWCIPQKTKKRLDNSELLIDETFEVTKEIFEHKKGGVRKYEKVKKAKNCGVQGLRQENRQVYS